MVSEEKVVLGEFSKKKQDEDDHFKKIRCLIFSLVGRKMVIPNVSVAEVTDVHELNSLEEGAGLPDWFRGLINWRDQQIPFITFEKIIEGDSDIPKNYHNFLVLNAPNIKGLAPFIVIGTQTAPSMTMISQKRTTINTFNGKEQKDVAKIYLDEEDYYIPDIKNLENKINDLRLD